MGQIPRSTERIFSYYIKYDVHVGPKCVNMF